MAEAGHGAVFLDRDGTIIEDPPPGYLHQPEAVRLLPGAGGAIHRLNQAGWPVVVISNQSGIARRLYPEADYYRVQARLEELLRAEGGGGARIDAALFCPHHPDLTGPCDCRKPGTKLFLEAAHRFQVEPAGSWFVGDQASDVAPAATLGGRGLLVLTGQGLAHRVEAVTRGVRIVTDLAAAVDVILGPVA